MRYNDNFHIAGGKSKEDMDSNNKDEIALAAKNTKKGGKKPIGRDKPKKENPNKDNVCNHFIKKGHIKTTCWESTLRRTQGLLRIVKAIKQTGFPLQQLQLMIVNGNLN